MIKMWSNLKASVQSVHQLLLQDEFNTFSPNRSLTVNLNITLTQQESWTAHSNAFFLCHKQVGAFSHRHLRISQGRSPRIYCRVA